MQLTPIGTQFQSTVTKTIHNRPLVQNIPLGALFLSRKLLEPCERQLMVDVLHGFNLCEDCAATGYENEPVDYRVKVGCF
eukprot:347478-Amphidinium_carterae.1